MVYPGSPLGEPSAERRRQLKRQVRRTYMAKFWTDAEIQTIKDNRMMSGGGVKLFTDLPTSHCHDQSPCSYLSVMDRIQQHGLSWLAAG